MKHSPRVHVEVRSCNKLRPKYVFFQRQWTSMVSHWINKINFDTFYTNFWKDDPDSYSRCVYVSCCFIHDPVFRTTLNIKKTTWNYYTIMELHTNHYVKGIAVIFMLQFIEMKDLNLNNFTFSHARVHNLCPNVRFFNWRPFNNSFCLRKCNTHPCILWSSGRPLKYIFPQNKHLYIFRNETKNRISNKIRLNNVISFFLFFFFKIVSLLGA